VRCPNIGGVLFVAPSDSTTNKVQLKYISYNDWTDKNSYSDTNTVAFIDSANADLSDAEVIKLKGIVFRQARYGPGNYDSSTAPPVWAMVNGKIYSVSFIQISGTKIGVKLTEEATLLDWHKIEEQNVDKSFFSALPEHFDVGLEQIIVLNKAHCEAKNTDS